MAVICILMLRAPRFSGYHQQDSQELLRCLLDALRSEEITVRKLEIVMIILTHVHTQRIKRAILTSYNVAGTKNKKDHLTDSDRADIRGMASLVIEHHPLFNLDTLSAAIT